MQYEMFHQVHFLYNHLVSICIFERDIINFILFGQFSIMKTHPTDKQISDKISAFLPSCLKANNNSLSNSVMFDSQHGVLFMFISNSYDPKEYKESNKFYMVVLNLSLRHQSGVQLHAIPIKLTSQLKSFSEQNFQKTKIQIAKNQYQQGLISISIKRQNQTKFSHKIYFSKLNIKDLMKEKIIEFRQIEMKYDRFHKFLWHAYVPDILLILTTKSLLIYKLSQSITEQKTEIQFTALKKANKIQTHKDTEFFNMSFLNVNNQDNKKLKQQSFSTSLFRKFELYLIDKVGRTYLLFPFLCQGIIVSNSQRQFIFQSQFQKKKTINQFINMLQFSPIKNKQDQSIDERQFCLLYKQNQVSKFLNNLIQIKSNKTNNTNYQSNILKDFSIFLIQNSTVISSCVFNKQERCNIVNVSFIPISEQVQFLNQGMNINNIQQFSVAQIISDQQVDIQSQISFLKPIGKNSLYFLQENKCFKINLQGLANYFQDKPSSYNEIIQVTKLFNAKQSNIIAINKNQEHIMLIRYNKNRFFYDVIALQGLNMTKNLKNINKQMQKIFQNIQSAQKKVKIGEDPVCQKVQNLDLSQIQVKLKKFSSDFKICVQNKMSRIKNLYEQIQNAKEKAEKHEKINNDLRNLIKEAETNDKKIKQLLDHRKKKSSPQQKELLSRIQNIKFLLDRLNDDSKMKINLEQTTVTEFQDQAKGVLKKMEQMRNRAQKKISELRKVTSESLKK